MNDYWAKKMLLKALSTANVMSLVKKRRDRIPSAIVDKMAKGEDMPTPKRIKWELTIKCNLNCMMCHQYRRRKEKGNKEFDYNQVKDFLDMLARHNIKKILLKGGEIFVRKDIGDILDYLDQHSFKFSFITNGQSIDSAMVKKLLSYRNLQVMNFSIDGLQETHNKIRRSPEAFSRVIDTIRQLEKRNFLLHIATVLMKENLDEVKGLLDLAVDLKADSIEFIMEMFHSEKSIALSREFAESELYISPSEKTDYGFSYEKLCQMRKSLRSYAVRSRIYGYVSPPIMERYPRQFYYKDYNKTPIRLMCESLLSANIDQKGNLLVCPFIKKSFGNVLETDILDLWNSEEIKEFRSRIVKNNLLPICRRCCALNCVMK